MTKTITHTAEGIKVITIDELKELPDYKMTMTDSNVEHAIAVHQLKHSGNNPKEVWVLKHQEPFKPTYYTRA